ncbi:MAG: hypothetical protein M0Q94_12200, partial [Candidatus Cloacimonetes bacterium]|nr:hypothetical protein [Candidatus Cloacimonadota bacterium]
MVKVTDLTRQQSRFYALMDGYSQSIDLYNKSLESSGISTQKFGIWQESSAAKLEKFQATLQGFWQSNIESDSLKDIITLGTDFIELLTTITNKIGMLATFAPLLTLTFALMNKSFWSLNSNIIATIASSWGLVLATKAEISAMTAGAAATAMFGNALKMIPGVALITAISILAGELLQWGINALTAKKQTEDLFDSSIAAFKDLGKEVQSLDQLKSKYDELNSKIIKTEAEKKELISIQEKLIQTFPTLTSHIDAEGNAIIDDNKALNENIQLKKDELELTKQNITETYKLTGEQQQQ